MSLAFVRGIHRWPVNSPGKGPVTRKMFPFDYVVMVQFSSTARPRLPIGPTYIVFTFYTNLNNHFDKDHMPNYVIYNTCMFEIEILLQNCSSRIYGFCIESNNGNDHITLHHFNEVNLYLCSLQSNGSRYGLCNRQLCRLHPGGNGEIRILSCYSGWVWDIRNRMLLGRKVTMAVPVRFPTYGWLKFHSEQMIWVLSIFITNEVKNTCVSVRSVHRRIPDGEGLWIDVG